MDERGTEYPRNWILDEILKSHHSNLVVIEQRIYAICHPTDSLLGIIVDTVSFHDFTCDLDVFANCTFGHGKNHITSAQSSAVLG